MTFKSRILRTSTAAVLALAVCAPATTVLAPATAIAATVDWDNPSGVAGSTLVLENTKPGPTGTKYTISGTSTYFTVDPNTGRMTFAFPATATPGTSWERYMTATRPDGSYRTTKIVFNTAEAAQVKGAIGTQIVLTNGLAAPAGTVYSVSGTSTYFSVDSSTGTVTFSVPSTATPGDYWTRSVRTTYPDGRSFITPIVFTASAVSTTTPVTVSPTADTDGDGLLDTWEVNGYDADGNGTIDVNFPAMGADYRKKDIYVEMDQMGNLMASAEELDKIVSTFASMPVSNPNGTTGINIHLDAGTARGAKYNLGGGGNVMSTRNLNNGVDDIPGIRSQYSAPARNNVFHYMVWADSYGTSSSSGQAQIDGRNFLVAVGPTNWGSASSTIRSATFIHELGHNLGLLHGGTDNVNDKPNYLSIMNYRYQLDGLHRTDGSLYLGYSQKVFPTLDENNLNEGSALGAAGQSWVWNWNNGSKLSGFKEASVSADYDLDGMIEARNSVDLNNDGVRGILTAPNDLTNMRFQPINPYAGASRRATSVSTEEITAEDARKKGLIK